ncbi:MAG: DinB family protein [Chloroflexi bacterium]|nr:DinB family protein [Chloroflexota bacterium]
MPFTLLFDLDDTLLDTNIETFIPAYFQALSGHLAPYVSSTLLIPALLSSTRLMMENDDPSRPLRDVFERDFYARLGIVKNEIAEALDEFYDRVFPRLESKTGRRPDAAPLIEWVISQGHHVAIATDPLFPLKATHQRLRWAGLDPAQFELVSSFENFHFSKSHTAYYAEMLGQLGWNDGAVLMIGNDVERDLIPAHRLGLRTYFVDGDPASSPGFEAGRGNLKDIRPWLESLEASAFEPSFQSPEAVQAILRSTPAVLQTLTASLKREKWSVEPFGEDWALNEIVCHLRDTEREIHHLQLRLLFQREDAFIPRPDTAVWASERDYLQVDGWTALQEFTAARLETVSQLANLDGSLWSRKARHAIFGPTSFLEVLGFMADHDRMHIQQVKKTLKNLQGERV